MENTPGFVPDSKEKALSWLHQDELLNLMSIDLLERGLVRIAWAGQDALLLEGPETFQIHCLQKAQWPELLRVLLVMLPQDRFVILRAHQEWFVEDLAAKSGFCEILPYFNSIYPMDFPLTDPLPSQVEIRPLTMAEFSFVRHIYQTVDDDGYIKERIEEGMLGAWHDGTLAGFIGTHQEGTVGLLEVLPQYRRRGIGRALEQAMVRRLRKEGRRAYGNIAAGNELSRIVHEKLGIRIGDQPVYWLFDPEFGITE